MILKCSFLDTYFSEGRESNLRFGDAVARANGVLVVITRFAFYRGFTRQKRFDLTALYKVRPKSVAENRKYIS